MGSNAGVEAVTEMGRVAHQLHKLLTARGKPPRHRQTMIQNRGLAADHPEFYMHIHSAEDLLAFINDENANNDPQDVTLNGNFTLTVYTNRHGHDDRYAITRTAAGWTCRHLSVGGVGDKGGRPGLQACLDQDHVSYPASLFDRMEWLWQQAADQGLSHDQVQTALNELATWVSDTERAVPQNGVWIGY
jgi:hypothetical protein